MRAASRARTHWFHHCQKTDMVTLLDMSSPAATGTFIGTNIDMRPRMNCFSPVGP